MSRRNLHLVDLKRLHTVVEVARAESITTAAQTLGLTQSAVSRTVAELEQALGVRLFDRLARGIQMTKDGRRLVAGATRLLAEVDDLVAEITSEPAAVTGRLRLGLGVTGPYANPAIATFAGRHPEAVIETVHGSEQALCPRLAQGELDFVIGSSSYLSRWRELEVRPLVALEQACMMRLDHPLTRVAQPTEADLFRYPLILPQMLEPTHSDIARRYAEHALLPLNPRYTTNSFDLMLMLLKETDAFLAMLHPDPAFAGLGQHFFLLRGVLNLPAQHVSLARDARRPRSQVTALFEEHLTTHFDADPVTVQGFEG